MLKNKILIIFLLFSCFGFSKKIPTEAFIKSSNTKIRKEINPASEVVTVLNEGDKVKILEKKGYFYKVDIGDDLLGFVFVFKLTQIMNKKSDNGILKDIIAMKDHELKESSSGGSIRATRSETYTEVNVDPLGDYTDILSKYGWNVKLDKEYSEYDSNVMYRVGELNSLIPAQDGYYSKMGICTLKYNDKTKIPEFDGNPYQEYVSYFGKGAFPIDKFKDLFPEVLVWQALRQDNLVYVFYSYKKRQDLSYMKNLLLSYLQIKSEEEIINFDNNLSKRYLKMDKIFKSIKIVQNILKDEGIYSGNVDGIMGNSTIVSFQTFLIKKGYYDGKLDGVLGVSTIKSIMSYQADLEVTQTGNIDFEMASAMKKK